MATGAGKAKPRQSSRQRKPKSRKTLVEWAVVYPVLIGSLLTAGPQWIDTVRAAAQGIHIGSVKKAQEQAQLWRKNLACAGAPFAWFSNPSNIKVDATICDSGDIFVRASTRDNKQYFKWLPLSDVVESDSGGDGLMSAAHAAALPMRASPAPALLAQGAVALAQPQANVICQKFIDDRHLLRRVQTPQGCFEEVIDTFNGSIVSRRAVPCNPQC